MEHLVRLIMLRVAVLVSYHSQCQCNNYHCFEAGGNVSTMVANIAKCTKRLELWNYTIFLKLFKFNSLACNSVGLPLFFSEKFPFKTSANFEL